MTCFRDIDLAMGEYLPSDFTAHTLRERVRDVALKSISFDLHGTLVTPVVPLNQHIYNAVKDVLVANGFQDVPAYAEAMYGTDAAAEIVTEICRDFYLRVCRAEQEVVPEGYHFPLLRWLMANAHALDKLVEEFGDRSRGPDLPSRLLRPGEELTGEPLRRSIDRLRQMSMDVHLRISGSRPEDWLATDTERALINHVHDRGLPVFVWSNGTLPSVVACVRRFFPAIPEHHVFAPERLANTGKPSWKSSALFLFNINIARVLERPPSTEWEMERENATRELFEQLTSADEVLPCVRAALEEWRRRHPAVPEARDMILPHDHLHVGNSEYHDELPHLGIELPFRIGIYQAEPPERNIRVSR